MHIFIARTDGGVDIMTLATPPEDTPILEHFIERELTLWKGSHPGQYVSHRVGDDNEVPADRTFRNAWKPHAGGIEVDMPKAVEIQKDRLRALRAPKLSALDVDYMRALEAGDTAAQASIAQQKRALRDVTADPIITKAKTPEELKAAIPECLA